MAAEARRNYQEAGSTIQAMLSLVENSRLEGMPRLLELRRNQREASLAFYERILNNLEANASKSDDTVVMMDTIRELGFAATLELKLGRSDRADKHLEQPLCLIEDLRKKPPDAIEFLHLEIETLMKRGNILVELGSLDRASATSRKAIESAEKLVQLAPDNIVWQELCAMCYNTYANAMHTSHRDAEAMPYYQKSTAIRERIDPSRLPGVTLRLAESIVNEGVVLWGETKITPAEEKFRRAGQLLLSMSPEERPSRGNRDNSLGLLYVNWSGLLHMSGRYQEAVAQADAGLSRLEPYLRNEPNDAVARRTCAYLHGNKGYALTGLAKHRESATEWTRVVELSPEPAPLPHRIRLALALAHAGDQPKALVQARLVKAGPDLPADECYNFACFFGVGATAVTRDPSVLPADRARLVEAHISDAMHYLSLAAKGGLFRNPAIRDGAKKDPELAILANRPEFLKLINTPDRYGRKPWRNDPGNSRDAFGR